MGRLVEVPCRPVRLHLVDGTFELFRAHHAKRPDRADRDGRDVKATTGLVASLLALVADDEEAVTHVAVAFDNPIRSFRNDLLPGYKDGTGVPEVLRAQFDRAEDACRAIGCVVWRMDEHEADDALATAAARFARDCDQVRILTVDKDLGQCVRGTRVVQVDRIRDRVTDEAALRARRGIAPQSVPDWLALVGDTADGIPGLPRFGERTASALLGRYEHLEGIPPDAADWDVDVRGGPRLAATLDERREEALLYRRVATLVTDVDLPEDLDGLCWRGVPREEYLDWCDRLGDGAVGGLRDRPHRWA